MQCSKHPEHTADGVCAYSGKPYCQNELVEVEGKLYGRDNLSAYMAEMREKGKANPMVFMNAGGGGGAAASSSAVGGQTYPLGTKSRATAIVLALFLGGIGAHKFYLGKPIQGLLYLIFCWTFIPAFFGFIEAIIFACTSDLAFSMKYR